MKIVIFGVAPWVKTAYGKNTRDLAAFLSANFDVDIVSYYGNHGADMVYGKSTVYPCYETFNELPSWVKFFSEKTKADVILQHFDVWVLPSNWIESIDTPVVTYSPVDSQPMHHRIKSGCKGAVMNVAMTKFAQREYAKNKMTNVYIPHWVDLDVFKPMDKRECRRAAGMPEDAFIVGIVGTNKSPRKNIPRQLIAYKNFLTQNDCANKSKIYLHTQMDRSHVNAQGYDLNGVVMDLGMEANIMSTRKQVYFDGFADEDVAKMYNCFDVLLHASLGEGFGMPIIEAQACGIPVIVSNFSAMPEVTGQGGIIVDAPEWDIQSNIHQWHKIPSTVQITEALTKLYTDVEFREEKRKAAIQNAKRYDSRKSQVRWLSLFSDLAQQFGW